MNICKICGNTFSKERLLESTNNDMFCQRCFKIQFCCSRGAPKNEYMFTSAELLEIRNTGGLSRSTISSSKRPLRCPHGDCNRHVSAYDLTTHFQHEHKDIPIVRNTDRFATEWRPYDIRYAVNKCLFLLSVMPKDGLPEDRYLRNKYSNQMTTVRPVTLLVLAARLAASQLSYGSESVVDDEGSMVPDDKIIIWVSSNVVYDGYYTITVSTMDKRAAFTYCGPILQLGHKPSLLCTKGEGMVLSRYHLVGLTQQGTKAIHLEVCLHDRPARGKTRLEKTQELR